MVKLKKRRQNKATVVQKYLKVNDMLGYLFEKMQDKMRFSRNYQELVKSMDF